jgi:hypothetical protein
MAYIDRPNDYIGDRTTSVAVTNYHDQVRWGPIVAGLAIALSTQLVLSALGAAVGLTSIGDSSAHVWADEPENGLIKWGNLMGSHVSTECLVNI